MSINFSNIDGGAHPCIEQGCTEYVAFDDEPRCFTHSPDSGSDVRGYSYRATHPGNPAECTKCRAFFLDLDDVFGTERLDALCAKGQIMGYADGDVLCKKCADHEQDLCDEAVERSVEQASQNCF